MVEAGETGGILDTILQRLSGYIEKAVKLKRAVQSALIYPIAVLGIAGGVIFLLLWKVVPIFANLFAGLGVDLPASDAYRHRAQQCHRHICGSDDRWRVSHGRLGAEAILRDSRRVAWSIDTLDLEDSHSSAI